MCIFTKRWESWRTKEQAGIRTKTLKVTLLVQTVSDSAIHANGSLKIMFTQIQIALLSIGSKGIRGSGVQQKMKWHAVLFIITEIACSFLIFLANYDSCTKNTILK